MTRLQRNIKESNKKREKNKSELQGNVDIMMGNLGTRFPQNLNTQQKYFVGVPLFDKIVIDMNIRIK